MFKFFFVQFLVFATLFANEYQLVTNYRTNGIKNIEKELDTILTKPEYWRSFLENKDLTFGYIEGYDAVLTCNKERSVLRLYKKDTNGSFSFAKEYSAFTGKEKGDKFVEGDLKTPVGIYNLTKRIDKLDSF